MVKKSLDNAPVKILQVGMLCLISGWLHGASQLYTPGILAVTAWLVFAMTDVVWRRRR